MLFCFIVHEILDAECALPGISSDKVILGKRLLPNFSSLPHSLSPSLTHSLTHSLTPSLTSLSPSLTHSLPPSVTPSLPPSLPSSLPPSLPPPLTPSGGFSQGGSLAIFSVLTYPRRLAGILGLSTYISLHQTIEKVSGVVSGTSDNGHSGQTAQPLPIY